MQTASNTLSVFPNPAHGAITINTMFENMISDAKLQVINQAGEVIIEKTVGGPKGNNTFTIDVRTLPTGNYFIALRAKEWARFNKFLKQ